LDENMTQDSPLQVGYVVSMAMGLQSFVYREVRELYSLGVVVHLFPTKVGTGPYVPDSDWPVHRMNLQALVATHLQTLLANARRYLAVLCEAVVLGGLIDFAVAVFVSRTAHEEKLNLIHCHFGDHKLFVGYFYGRLTNGPVSVTIHAYELYNNPNPRLFRKAIKSVKAVVTVADYNRALLCTIYGVDPQKIHVVPMFADLPPPSDARSENSVQIVVLTVARLVEKKGHRTLLKALGRLPENYEAWLVGDGPLDVAQIAKTYGVADRVRIFGRLSDSDLQASYRAANIFCLPSETTQSGDREGIPVALMEAMAYGLPIVATRHAGIPELVSEILVEEGDFVGLARGIEQLGEDPILRENLGRRNRELASARFSAKNVIQLKLLFEGLTQ
jgi:glycosyltransferase involved in cell wall biosynthesis